MERLTKRRKDGHADPARYTQFIGVEMDDKLADYEDAEEQGRLIEFPVAIGDHLWRIDDYGDIEEMVVGELVERRQGQTMLADTKEMRAYYSLNLIGKKIFHTREEAEAKLKEMEN